MKTATAKAVRQHGENLLAIFPNATERDPVQLCSKLRRLERQAAAIALRLCNGPEYPEGAADAACEKVLEKVNALLGNVPPLVPVFINRDPRGYSLKIDDTWMRQQGRKEQRPLLVLHADWGGYGIIAPDLSDAE